MKILAGISIGVTASILAYIIGRPTISWVFTRVPPATHPDSRPRFKSWRDGVMTEGAWT